MALGGRVAESVTFNTVTSGAQDDLRKITKMAYAEIRTLGMNPRIGHISFPESSDGSFGSKPYSKQLSALMDEVSQRESCILWHCSPPNPFLFNSICLN